MLRTLTTWAAVLLVAIYADPIASAILDLF